MLKPLPPNYNVYIKIIIIMTKTNKWQNHSMQLKVTENKYLKLNINTVVSVESAHLIESISSAAMRSTIVPFQHMIAFKFYLLAHFFVNMFYKGPIILLALT